MQDYRFHWGWFLFFLISFFVSCTEEVVITPKDGLLERYFPLKDGDIRTYQVDSITYDFDGTLQKIVIDSSRYFLREEVGEPITMHGESWHRIALFRSALRDGDYQLVDYVYERIDQNRLMRKEGHLTFIVLSSPLSLYDEWDGTAYFNASETTRFVRGEIIKPYEEWNYLYLKAWENYVLAERTYQDVIQINQRDTVSIQVSGHRDLKPEEQLFYHLANEFYAPGTGLIKKEQYHLTSICASSSVEQFQNYCDTTTIFENAERGFIYNKILLSRE